MSAEVTWSVATPEGVVASGTSTFLVVPTERGELGVMADHAALAACTVPGELRVTNPDASVRTIHVERGIVDVRDNVVKLLVLAAEAAKPRS